MQRGVRMVRYVHNSGRRLGLVLPEDTSRYFNRPSNDLSLIPGEAWGNLFRHLVDYEKMDDVHQLFYEVWEDGMQFRENTILAIIRAFVRNGHLQGADHYFDELKVRGMASCRAYNVMIGACGRSQQVRKAFSYAAMMDRNGVERDEATFKGLLTACAVAQDYQLALQTLADMRESGHEPGESGAVALIKCCRDAADVTASLEVLKEDFPLSTGAMNETIHRLLYLGDYGLAYRQFRDLIANGTEADNTSFHTLIRASIQSGRIQEGLALFDEMKDNGYEPTRATYSTMMHIFSDRAMVDKGMEILQNMIDEGSLPYVKSWDVILAHLCEHDCPDEVIQVWEMVKSIMSVPPRPFVERFVRFCRSRQMNSLLKEATAFLGESY